MFHFLLKCEGPIDEKYPHIVREEHCPAIEGDHSEPTSVGGDSSVKLEGLSSLPCSFWKIRSFARQTKENTRNDIS